MAELHEVIQSLTDFSDDHFIVEKESLDGKKYIETISDCQDVLTKVGQTIVYNFDFGDDWIFKIKETNSPSNLKEGNYW